MIRLGKGEEVQNSGRLKQHSSYDLRTGEANEHGDENEFGHQIVKKKDFLVDFMHRHTRIHTP